METWPEFQKRLETERRWWLVRLVHVHGANIAEGARIVGINRTYVYSLAERLGVSLGTERA